MKIIHVIGICFLMQFMGTVWAKDEIWMPVDASLFQKKSQQFTHEKNFRVDEAQLRHLLTSTRPSSSRTKLNTDKRIYIDLPFPDGGFVEVELVDSNLLGESIKKNTLIFLLGRSEVIITKLLEVVLN